MSALREFLHSHSRLAVLTGAGVSTSSGIPDYRDEQGEWKRARPVDFRPFMTDAKVRQRYWARSTFGWPFVERAQMQRQLLADNPDWAQVEGRIAPDGDVDIDGRDYSGFVVPECPHCGGILKPDVVFFGESVPRERVDRAFEGVAQADALLVVGSSLMVYSGYRFAEAAAAAGKPIAAVNLGRTRADHLLTLKIGARCDEVLAAV